MTINKKSTVSFQNQLKQIIMSQIESGELRPGSKIPSERELSEIYDVSRATSKGAVLALLNDGIVTRTAGKGTFIREDLLMKDKDNQKTQNIGFVLHQPKALRMPIETDPVFMTIFGDLQKEILKRNYHLMFMYVDETVENEMESFRSLSEKVDGMIIAAVGNRSLISILERRNLPHVLIFPNINVEDKIVIDFDHLNSGKKSVAHLIERGHRRIALINGPLTIRSAQFRYQGAKEALKTSGISITEELSIDSNGWLTEDGFDAAKKILALEELPTAIYCANDLLAVGALRACREKGLKVPDDISIIGCDNTFMSEHSIPSLSSIDIHKTFMGKIAAEQLFEILINPDYPPITTTLPVRLVARNSVREI